MGPNCINKLNFNIKASTFFNDGYEVMIDQNTILHDILIIKYQNIIWFIKRVKKGVKKEYKTRVY